MQRISPIKSRSICLFSDQTSFKSAEFFFFLATLPSQKIVKEIAYIPTSSRPLLKARNFYLFACSKTLKIRDNERCEYFIHCFVLFTYLQPIIKVKSKLTTLFNLSLNIVTASIEKLNV